MPKAFKEAIISYIYCKTNASIKRLYSQSVCLSLATRSHHTVPVGCMWLWAELVRLVGWSPVRCELVPAHSQQRFNRTRHTWNEAGFGAGVGQWVLILFVTHHNHGEHSTTCCVQALQFQLIRNINDLEKSVLLFFYTVLQELQVSHSPKWIHRGWESVQETCFFWIQMRQCLNHCLIVSSTHTQITSPKKHVLLLEGTPTFFHLKHVRVHFTRHW